MFWGYENVSSSQKFVPYCLLSFLNYEKYKLKHSKHSTYKKYLKKPLSLTWGCQQLKWSGLPLCPENKRKNAGSFVSVKHGRRAWQTKELVTKEPFA